MTLQQILGLSTPDLSSFVDSKTDRELEIILEDLIPLSRAKDKENFEQVSRASLLDMAKRALNNAD